MNLVSAPITDETYVTVCEWWKSHDWPVIPPDCLPEDGLLVSDESGCGIAAGWVYKSNSKIAWIEWVVANPEYDKILRGQALDVLIEKLLNKARENGAKVVFTATRHQGLTKRYVSAGFKISDEGMTHLLWL